MVTKYNLVNKKSILKNTHWVKGVISVSDSEAIYYMLLSFFFLFFFFNNSFHVVILNMVFHRLVFLPGQIPQREIPLRICNCGIISGLKYLGYKIWKERGVLSWIDSYIFVIRTWQFWIQKKVTLLKHNLVGYEILCLVLLTWVDTLNFCFNEMHYS